MKALLLETERTGYAPEQIYRTMTVGELIAQLSEFDEDTPIYFSNDNGYTYGGINYDSIREYESEDEEAEEDEEEDLSMIEEQVFVDTSIDY